MKYTVKFYRPTAPLKIKTVAGLKGRPADRHTRNQTTRLLFGAHGHLFAMVRPAIVSSLDGSLSLKRKGWRAVEVGCGMTAVHDQGSEDLNEAAGRALNRVLRTDKKTVDRAVAEHAAPHLNPDLLRKLPPAERHTLEDARQAYDAAELIKPEAPTESAAADRLTLTAALQGHRTFCCEYSGQMLDLKRAIMVTSERGTAGPYDAPGMAKALSVTQSKLSAMLLASARTADPAARILEGRKLFN